MDLTQYLKIEVMAAVTAVFAAAVGLVILAIRIFRPASSTVSTKLLGSILVLALAFAANLHVVYALAIFIVATLVTDLDFLEKIAAIFWNRDKYWDYRIAQASPAEVAAKAKQDAELELTVEALQPAAPAPEPAAAQQPVENPEAVDEEAEALPSAPPAQETVDLTQLIETEDDRIARARSFEKAVLEAIREGKSPFPIGTLRTGLRLVTPGGQRIIDGVIDTPKADFVIEVKYLRRPSLMVDAAASLIQYAQDYSAYLRERGARKLVIPVLVIPPSIGAPVNRQGFVVAMFNLKNKEFSNARALKADIERALRNAY